MKRVLTIFWALVIGAVLVALGAAVLLPSTKRGSIDLEEYQRLRNEAATRTSTQPATQPTTVPTTAPANAELKPGDAVDTEPRASEAN